MGWRINLVKNDLVLTPEACEGIAAIKNDCYTTRGDHLYFNSNHLEWMDYVWDKKVLAVIKKHKLSGEILFSSSEGDNANTGWGYRFEKGKLTNLERNSAREYVPEGDPSLTAMVETEGKDAESLEAARPGDYVAVGCHMFGITSYEKEEVGDILPDGTIVVSGREYRAPNYRATGDFGSFTLLVLSDPRVDLELEDAE